MRRRGLFAASIVMALVSAGGLGMGLLGLGPLLEQILDPGGQITLQSMAQTHNDSGAWLQVPDWLIPMLPVTAMGGVVMLIVGLCVLTIAGATANFLHQYLAQTLVTRTVADIRHDVAAHALRLPLALMVTRGPSEFVSRIVRDAVAVEAGLLAIVGKGVAQVTKGAAALGAAVVFDARIVLIAVIVGPILGVILRKLAKRVHRGTRGSLEAQQSLLGDATQVLQGIRGIRTAAAEHEAMRRIDEANERVVHHELRIRVAKALTSPLLETLAIFVLGGLAIIAAREILSGDLTFDRFLLSLGALAVATAALRPIAGLINEIAASEAPAQRLDDVLEEALEPDGEQHLERHAKSIELQGVTYTYPGTQTPAVDGVDLQIEFGEHLAIVGTNGSGKTTLLSLLPRLFVPSSGLICIDGVDINSVTAASLRGQMAVVTQEPLVLAGTIAQNIRLGLEASDEQVREAARAGRALEFIESLPQGMDTQVAEGGATLSGGQRQRLSIARALLRDPSILILDEATSQVDSTSEALIAEAIRGIQGRTVLVIAHRLATVVDCDRIVVLDQGRVIDVGTHAQLLARCDCYASLVQTQLVQVEA
ncbi:MAG: ABC transporter ATP-binding protein/permease [Phycisphaerales bacterium]|nr:ABC transporter ATP-binding protein/permease [Phycisphaerales bacterium]